MKKNNLYDLPDELIEYIFNIIYKDHFSDVLAELKERTLLRNNDRVHEIVENYVEELIQDVLNSIHNQL